MKCCTKCGQEKALEEFPPQKRMLDGRSSWCRVCVYAKNREWAANNRDKVRASIQKWKDGNRERVRHQAREYDRAKYWADPEAGRAKKLAQYHSDPETWRARHTAKPAVQKKAWWRVHELTRSGRLERPSACPRCGRSDLRIEAHHPDHAQPEVVEFVCSKCHGETRRIG